MELVDIVKLTKKAIDDFNLIDDGEKIVVGISGGKDSLTVFLVLDYIRKEYNMKFELIPVCVSAGFENVNYDGLKKFFSDMGYNLIIINTNIKKIVFDVLQSIHPCKVCSKLRKKAIWEYMKANNIKKLCYGHHKDDLVETLLMDVLFFSGVNTFLPKKYFPHKKIFIIRPMIYVKEKDIIDFASKNELPIMRGICPAENDNSRNYLKNLMDDLDKINEKKPVRDSLFNLAMDYIKKYSYKGEANIIKKIINRISYYNDKFVKYINHIKKNIEIDKLCKKATYDSDKKLVVNWE